MKKPWLKVLINPPFNIPRGAIGQLHLAKISGKRCYCHHGIRLKCIC